MNEYRGTCNICRSIFTWINVKIVWCQIKPIQSLVVFLDVTSSAHNLSWSVWGSNPVSSRPPSRGLKEVNVTCDTSFSTCVLSKIFFFYWLIFLLILCASCCHLFFVVCSWIMFARFFFFLFLLFVFLLKLRGGQLYKLVASWPLMTHLLTFIIWILCSMFVQKKRNRDMSQHVRRHEFAWP